MSTEHLLRLAWQAEQDGRAGMRDALLTLAVVESGPDDAVLAERCRKQLIARRPDHWFASFPTRGQALDHPRVVHAIERIRATFPPVRVERLLMRGESQRGPYTGRSRSLPKLLDDLFGPPMSVATTPRNGEIPALPFPGGGSTAPMQPERSDDPGAVLVYYLTVLLAIAILLATVLPPAANDSRAA